jgi:hypothetical protein
MKKDRHPALIAIVAVAAWVIVGRASSETGYQFVRSRLRCAPVVSSTGKLGNQDREVGTRVSGKSCNLRGSRVTASQLIALVDKRS